jgi:hypothetical protein
MWDGHGHGHGHGIFMGGFGARTRVEGLCCRIFQGQERHFCCCSPGYSAFQNVPALSRRPGVWAVDVGGGRSDLGMFSTVFRSMLCCCAAGRHDDAGGVFRLTCSGSMGFLGHSRSFFCTKSFQPFSVVPPTLRYHLCLPKLPGVMQGM